MSRMTLPLLALAVGTIGILTWSLVGKKNVETVFEPPSRPIEAGTPCPWRNAESDLTNWFPGATGYETRDLILSGKRLILQERLGRAVLPDEMALHYYSVRAGTTNLGSVLPRRIKG